MISEKIQVLQLFYFLLLVSICSCSQMTDANIPKKIIDVDWITLPAFKDSATVNSWLVFHKEITIEHVPATVTTQLAADSKYWLWVNDKLVTREGGLKWGPIPEGYYYDEADIAPFLKAGKNEIDVLVWYFGKDGFSHKSSGKAALQCRAADINLVTDSTWQVAIHPAFKNEGEKPVPNWRLSESNIFFDATQIETLSNSDQTLFGFDREKGSAFTLKNTLPHASRRSIPQWKDFGLRPYENQPDFPFISDGDTMFLSLPYNAQVTPYFEIESPANLTIDIRTDNYRGGGAYNIRTNYLTTDGNQRFESPAWFNGHQVRYHFPKGITVLDLKFRESGYATEFTGNFSCDDPFYNRLWQKSLRTLYVTMRDNYMDCPDRERAQWWGDVVLESGETFYAMDRQSDLLTRKAILELMNWQKDDHTIFSPVPAGNWKKELPTQMLASVGYFGIWNYYQHTGDTATIAEIYPAIKNYLNVWKTDADGLVIQREGGWTWGDWGDEKDMSIIFNGWYYLALKGFANMAGLTGHAADQEAALEKMKLLKKSFNEKYWTGTAYRSPTHKGATDDRAQALAVVTGIAPAIHYPLIRKQLETQFYASPYFEKYVLEALFQMGYPEDALSRMKKRFTPMVESELSTLWEGWDIGSAKWGGGTYNHAWSGGGLTLLSQYVAGIVPLEAGYKKVQIHPQLGNLKKVAATVDTPLGLLNVKIEKTADGLKIDYEKPDEMEVIIIDQ